jgi:hypothetical protein
MKCLPNGESVVQLLPALVRRFHLESLLPPHIDQGSIGMSGQLAAKPKVLWESRKKVRLYDAVLRCYVHYHDAPLFIFGPFCATSITTMGQRIIV